MAAARGVGLPLRSATVEAVIGLLATTELGVGEAIRYKNCRGSPRVSPP